MAGLFSRLRDWVSGTPPAPEGPKADADPRKGSFARELFTLRVRTVYSTSSRPAHDERDNRLRLFQLSRLYADYLDALQERYTERDLYGGVSTFTELEQQASTLLHEDRAKEKAGSDVDRLTPAQRDIVGRIQRVSQRTVREIFHPRLRAWRQEQSAPGGVEDPEDAVVAAGAAGTERGRGFVPGAERSGLSTSVDVPADESEDLDEPDTDEVGPVAFSPQPDRDQGPSTTTVKVQRGLTLDDLAAQLRQPAEVASESDDDEPKSFRAIGEDNALTGGAETSATQADGLTPMQRWAKAYFLDNLHWDNELLADGLVTVGGVPAALLPPELVKTRRYPELELSRVLQGELEQALELGTDLIALETSMTLSGDITTTISPLLPHAQRDLYLALHQDGMRTALSYWTSIIEALRAFLSSLFDAAVGKDES